MIMERLKRTVCSVGAGAALLWSSTAAWADVRPNYETIAVRNAFSLRPPPPPQVAPPPPAAPLAKVIVTGFTSLGGNTKVLLEITENDQSKALRKPILQEG